MEDRGWREPARRVRSLRRRPGFRRFRAGDVIADNASDDATPRLVFADREGVVRGSFAGPVTATDLGAAVATARETPPT